MRRFYVEFKEYSKIKNSYDDKTVNKIKEQVDNKIPFVVLEKIHGANFGIHLDIVTNEVKFSKRSGFLGEDEVFYSHTRIAPDLIRSIRALSLQVKYNTISVYGEIFGGNFFGDKEEGAKKVQDGVYYHKDTKFMAFDLVIDGVNINWAKASRLLATSGFDLTPVITVAKNFDEALEVNAEFNSMVPLYYGLITPETENFAEGVVIKPFSTDITLANGKRLILKKKHPKFSEKKNKVKKEKVPVVFDEETQAILEDLLLFITENRLDNVVSKIGAITHKDFGKVSGLLVQDAIESYEEEVLLGWSLRDLIGDDWEAFNKEIMTEAQDTLRANLSKYLED